MCRKNKDEIIACLREKNSFLIAAHVHPEGDSIGSQLAMANWLESMGKTVRIINSDSVPKNLMFLNDAARIELYDDVRGQNIEFDAAIVLDCPVLDRVGAVAEVIKDKFIISIDHHVSNDGFGTVRWIDGKASSVGEMIYDLCQQAGDELDDLRALYIYVAIMTDTGSFHYSNTTVKTHQIASELLSYRVNPTQVYEYIYETKSFDALKLLADVLCDLQRTEDGKFVWFKVTNQMLSRNRLPREATDDFIDFVRMVEGSEVVAFLKELETPGQVKVSLRSKSGIDVNKVAQEFGGGGHFAASGCLLKMTMAEAEELIVAAVKKAIKGQG